MSGLTLWRLSPAYHAGKSMSGDGAYRRGGRWNPPGIRVVYCAESRSLAVVEVLANIKQASILGDQAWVLIPVEVPADLRRATELLTSLSGQTLFAFRQMELNIQSVI